MTEPSTMWPDGCPSCWMNPTDHDYPEGCPENVRLLWVFRFFRWYVAAGSNGTKVTRIVWGTLSDATTETVER